MPIYDYECKPCEATMSIHGNMIEHKVPLCVSCEKPMTRVYSIGAVTFKGSGFYSTDKK
jgi:putative FmdB family regulatory protein